MVSTPSASYSLTLRVKLSSRAGTLGELTTTIGRAGGDIGAIDIISATRDSIIRDVTVNAASSTHVQEIVNAVRDIDGIEVINVSDRTFLMHIGGKIEVVSKMPLKTRDDLSMAYTPGVARVCEAIRDDPEKAFTLTIKKNTVAVVSDGTAVLGLGDIGPAAAMPVMEGKCQLFKEFGGVDAFPICLDTKDPHEIVQTIKHISTVFGGINLEDISAPRCFEIEDRLKEELDIPVFHDDQHGTSVVVLAAALNALKVLKKKMSEIKILIVGAGAAGVAVTKMLQAAGARHIICCDRKGIICRKRLPDLDSSKTWLAEHTNARNVSGSVEDAARGAHLFIGVSGPGVFTVKALKKMAKDAIVFALANPTPEIMPEDAEPYARIIATGRSDYSNQINNVLAFPGIFRGALDARARAITEPMKLAAAKAIA